ncbi:hypothetical protein AYW79_08235 [Ferroacidibacillus organovorans]|uniref:Uncharacterized protein n=1 Tax=Ferroacidibacillus organovorans TaxID=1765683 RepID=A0A853KA68_9BACL|nr:hypothetical protein AYJ22_08265 [Ferroacidibacillus organovorans]OAG93916.1 hypothetical protein AYW79_08235 [Ferroacidibacillus organovorans]
MDLSYRIARALFWSGDQGRALKRFQCIKKEFVQIFCAIRLKQDALIDQHERFSKAVVTVTKAFPLAVVDRWMVCANPTHHIVAVVRTVIFARLHANGGLRLCFLSLDLIHPSQTENKTFLYNLVVPLIEFRGSL